MSHVIWKSVFISYKNGFGGKCDKYLLELC